ncbi:hypothetical protein SAMN05444521_8423 [Streptomyces sp. 3214.6]|nr:hypothetical protein SAMN05444521_8423 [Streptomyces sp. 3214.6]
MDGDPSPQIGGQRGQARHQRCPHGVCGFDGVYVYLRGDKAHQGHTSRAGSDIQYTESGVFHSAAVETTHLYRVVLGLKDVVELGADRVVVLANPDRP